MEEKKGIRERRWRKRTGGREKRREKKEVTEYHVINGNNNWLIVLSRFDKRAG